MKSEWKKNFGNLNFRVIKNPLTYILLIIIFLFVYLKISKVENEFVEALTFTDNCGNLIKLDLKIPNKIFVDNDEGDEEVAIYLNYEREKLNDECYSSFEIKLDYDDDNFWIIDQKTNKIIEKKNWLLYK